jgi:hypothetical protein
MGMKRKEKGRRWSSGILCSPLSATKLGVVWILSVLETRNSWVDGARYVRS